MSIHIRWQALLITVGVALLVIVLVYQAIGLTTILVPAEGGVYSEGLAGAPQYLNPLLSAYNDVDRDLTALIFNGLVRLDARGKPAPDLASRWEIAPDGRTYTVTLRSDVRWQDGVAFTAEDVLFTIGLLQDPGYTGPADLAALWRQVEVESVASGGADALRFTIPEPFAPFLDYLTIGILPQHVLRNVSASELPGHPFNLKPVGTGPFVVDEVVNAGGYVSQITLSANPTYSGRRPYLSKVEFRFYPDHASVIAAYQAGEIQGIGHVLPGDLPRVRAEPRLNLLSSLSSEMALVFLRLDDPNVAFLQDRRIRQALLYGLDRQALIDRVLDGQGAIANSPLLPGSWAYAPSMGAYTYDPQRAGQLLDEAGWRLSDVAAEGVGRAEADPAQGRVRQRDGSNMVFSLSVADDPLHQALAEEIVRQWRALGIAASVQVIPPGEVHAVLDERRFQAILVGLDVPGDPDPYAFWHESQIEHGQNYAGLKSRAISEVLEHARRTTDDAERAALYQTFQTLFAEQLPALPLYYPVYTYAVDENVGGVQIIPLNAPGDRFRNIADWYVIRRRVVISQSGRRG
jgi:peptide/nickel transport system substrate-binding protein